MVWTWEHFTNYLSFGLPLWQTRMDEPTSQYSPRTSMDYFIETLTPTLIFLMYSCGKISMSMCHHSGLWHLIASSSWCNKWPGPWKTKYRSGGCLGSEKAAKSLHVTHPHLPHLNVSHPSLGCDPVGWKHQKDSWDTSTHSFFTMMNPRQFTEAQIPETIQTRQRVSLSLAIFLMLIRSRRALLNRREYKCRRLG